MRNLTYIFVAGVLLLSSCTNENSTKATDTSIERNSTNYTGTITNAKPVDYIISEPKVYTTPNRTLYRANVIIKGNDGLDDELNKKLLLYIYDSIKNTSSEPNAVGLFLFQTEEHSKSGMGQWVAKLSKAKVDLEPTVDIQHFKPKSVSNEIAAYDKSLTLDQRKLIFKEAIVAEDKATILADKNYPLSVRNNFDKNENLRNQLMKKYRNEVKKKYKLTEKTLKAISSEGLEYNWPMPPMLKDF